MVNLLELNEVLWAVFLEEVETGDVVLAHDVLLDLSHASLEDREIVGPLGQ
jgi:hypothetical protein